MKIANIAIIILLLALSPNIANATIVYSKADSLTYESYIKQVSPYKNEPINELVIRTAKFFIGRPYVASTLEGNTKENLVINLHEFDCTTFVETCIALSKVIKSDDLSFSNYCQTLTSIRYRNGVIDDYSSRLHYSSDWIYENEQKKIFKDISIDLGGKISSKKINYMSTHPQLYSQLKNNNINIRELRGIENKINERNNYKIIPSDAISSGDENILDGDIVLFGTNINGLDYSHMGIAYRSNNILRFIHASSRAKKIIIESKSLDEYCAESKTCNGITILRLN
ncbi:N-acetylmuramoyl-L-alanine amidase-like domain-containing protein [Dysgonomonas sp. ZJ279]|uniref:N-acetylmuramoyl-L-alanine amidase-like domain-containing protein n=1 Tax=Dysgonomonas sp. ZJ279 TaxID=2709796 RepID=UPI0013EAADA7|nr:N-acetylmuramoyl-L-alanine amidase-like domain-containing protein [Dysgonomonas sp. ZJ279]